MSARTIVKGGIFTLRGAQAPSFSDLEHVESLGQKATSAYNRLRADPNPANEQIAMDAIRAHRAVWYPLYQSMMSVDETPSKQKKS